MIKGKILISEENKEAIEQLLNQAQNKTHVRCFNAKDMMALANAAEAQLNSLGVPKKMRHGTIVHYSEYASKKAKQWSEYITEVKLKREQSGWYLIVVNRISRSWEGRINHLYLSEEAIHFLCEQLRHLKLEE